MIIKKILFLVLFYGVLPLTLMGQDLHFSDFHSFSNYFNPATTGWQHPTLTVNFQHRSQWAQIPQAYQSTGINLQQKKDRFAIGGLLYKNGAGPASLQTTGGLFTGAYYQQLAKGENNLALGLGLGFLQKRFDPTALSFDEQYQGSAGFDIANSNRENFVQTNASAIDFTIGGLWTGTFSRNKPIKTQLGIALSHIHIPLIGFQEELNTMDSKLVLHGQMDLPIGSKNKFRPNFMYQRQGVHRSLTIGAHMRRQLPAKAALRTGISYRVKDALILKAGLDWGNKSLTLHYDLNNSTLSKATNGQGAFELAFAIQLGKRPKKKTKDKDKDGIYDHLDKCPNIPGEKEHEGCPVPKSDMEEIELDSDGDRVPDTYDDCPNIPGLKYLHGCPDTDKDGVVDPDDACPRLPGSVKNGGCPSNIKDTDRDGVPDSEDYCIFLRGLPKFHGCPDSDKDNISDIDDECPYLKGDKANNGCPAKATKQLNLKVVVTFDTDQYALQPVYTIELDEMIEQLADIQEYKIMISGHTDSEGNAAYNHTLGQKRAQEIQQYLRQGGVPISTIHTISYGEARPKRDNESTIGKAVNRRAEVVVIIP